MGDVLCRAMKLIVPISLIFWALSYSSDGNISNSFLYKIGAYIEPVTIWFGLRWQMFVAFLAAMMGKEAALGVLATIFGAAKADVWALLSKQVVETGGDELGGILLSTISRPEALAFIYAVFFSTPCLMAIAATNQESHSLKWTLRITGYYTAVALLMSAISYNVGLLIF
jgi:ferrous iron transport protein B